MAKPTKLIVAYVLGQATQLVIHGMVLAYNMWNNRQIPFCMAAGFIVLFALIMGVYIAKPTEEEPKHEKKTYLDWAEIPESDGVVNPLAKKK